jgi:hypothetical protein
VCCRPFAVNAIETMIRQFEATPGMLSGAFVAFEWVASVALRERINVCVASTAGET